MKEERETIAFRGEWRMGHWVGGGGSAGGGVREREGNPPTGNSAEAEEGKRGDGEERMPPRTFSGVRAENGMPRRHLSGVSATLTAKVVPVAHRFGSRYSTAST